MAALGALSQAWTSAEAALPLGWRMSGLYRFDELWVGLAGRPEFDDYASDSGQYAEQALRRLADRLRERRGSTTGTTCARTTRSRWRRRGPPCWRL